MLEVSLCPPHPMQLEDLTYLFCITFQRPTPPVIGSSGPAGYGHVSQPVASACVQPQQPNVGNSYYNEAQYNNPLCVPYARGVTN